MPRSTREWAKRKIDSADGNLTWVITHMDEVIGVYIDEHPDIALPLEQIKQVCTELRNTLIQVRKTF